MTPRLRLPLSQQISRLFRLRAVYIESAGDQRDAEYTGDLAIPRRSRPNRQPVVGGVVRSPRHGYPPVEQALCSATVPLVHNIACVIVWIRPNVALRSESTGPHSDRRVRDCAATNRSGTRLPRGTALPENNGPLRSKLPYPNAREFDGADTAVNQGGTKMGAET